jgi:GTP-binding protein LepA
MRAQYLDQMDLERERGITIKMAPVRMHYKLQATSYILNLIDTPGHSDFSYEVSRALAAVEGAILLVDVTKGIQAQTLSNFRAAKKAGLVLIGAVNKMDVGSPNAEEVIVALAELLDQEPQDIFRVSAKTGDGVEELLQAVVKKVPPPTARRQSAAGAGAVPDKGPARALIFDSIYDDHKGILAYVRAFDGAFTAGQEAHLAAGDARFKIKEAGYFLPQLTSTKQIATGEIGYIATGLKEPEKVKIGDTVFAAMPGAALGTAPGAVAGAAPGAESGGGPGGGSGKTSAQEPLAGYREPAPVVFISFYPDASTKFDDLKKGLDRLRLTDAALRIEPDANEALGRGLKVGFLGQLHFDIIATRLKREFNLDFLTSFPSIAYRVQVKGESRVVKEPHDFPVDAEKVWEPMIAVEIITPPKYLQGIVGLQNVFSLEIGDMITVGGSLVLKSRMPLSELIRDFDDQLKSLSAGFASFSYELDGEQETNAEKLEILVAGEVVSALTRIVAKKDVEREARQTVERLKELLPREQFSQAIQARVRGRFIARETLPPMKKDVTGYLYGGDRTRKMKLWKKQKRGKVRLKEMAKVNVPVEVFREILKK